VGWNVQWHTDGDGEPSPDPRISPKRLAKTDALDAEALARFAEVIGPEPRSLADVCTFRLRELVVGVAPFNRDSGRWRGKGRQGCGEGGAVHGDVGGDQMESGDPRVLSAVNPGGKAGEGGAGGLHEEASCDPERHC